MKNTIYTCMECGKEFEWNQILIKDSDNNGFCPYCNSGDISWVENSNE